MVCLCSTWSLILQQPSPKGFLKQQEGKFQYTGISQVSAYITFIAVLMAKAIHMTKHRGTGPTKGHGYGKAWIHWHYDSSRQRFLISELTVKASPAGSSVQLVLSPGCQIQRPLRHNRFELSVAFGTGIFPSLRPSSPWASTHRSPDPLPASPILLCDPSKTISLVS